jgi:hypothetical protein
MKNLFFNLAGPLQWRSRSSNIQKSIGAVDSSVMPEGEKLWGGPVVIGGHNLPSPG